MKKVTSFVLAHLLYWLGYLFCLLAERSKLLCLIFFRPYQTLMHWSVSVEEWADTDFVWSRGPKKTKD